MPSLWMDVDAALTEVPVNIMPLMDDTDFKSAEVSVAYDQAGMDLVWQFVTPAGATTQTAVTPTTGGDYDWAHQGKAMYTIEIPASGGVSINNDTEGFGWFIGYATGVLRWRGPVIGFRDADLNNLLIESAYSATRGLAGTALPAAVADAAGGLPISDAGALDLDALNTAAVRLTAGRAGALTDWLDGGRLDLLLDAIPTTAMRGTDNAATAAVLGALADAAAAGDPTTGDTVMQYVKQLINVLVGTAGIGTFPAAAAPANAISLAEVIRAVYDDTTVIGAAGAGLTDLGGMSTGMKAEVESEVDDALATYDPPTKAEMDTGHGLLTTPAEVATELATYDAPTKAEMDTGHGLLATPAEVATELATYDGPTKAEMDTGHGLLTTPAEVATELATYDGPTKAEMDAAIAALNDLALADITGYQLVDSIPADGTLPTIPQSLYMITQFLYERAVSSTTVTVKKADGSTTLLTLTLDDATDPTSITRAT